jgi:L-ascorbate metabolism protein UlaG (beta-lactamase superfamily)
VPRSVNPYYCGLPSDHFDGLRFFNPDHPDTDRGLSDLLRWKLKGTAAPWPRSVPVRQTIPDDCIAGLRATIVGHASVLIQAGGINVLTDPVWSERASPLRFAGPRRVWAPGIAFESLPQIDAVLLSHNHYDHLDLATLRRLHIRNRPLMVTPLGNDAILRRAIPGVRVVAGDWWDRIEIGKGGGMRRRIGRPDLALIPIGAYAPRWFMCAQHTDPNEAVQILEDLEASRAVGIHWGVFRLTDEHRDEPPELLLKALAHRGIAANLFPAGVPGLSYEPV